MTRSRILFSALAAACLAAASTVSYAADRVVSAVSYGFDCLLSAWVEPFQLQAKAPGQEKPRVALVASKGSCCVCSSDDQRCILPGGCARRSDLLNRQRQ